MIASHKLYVGRFLNDVTISEFIQTTWDCIFEVVFVLSCCLDSNRRVYVEDSRVFETFRGGCNDTKHLPKKSALLQSKVAISITVKFY